MLVSPQYAARRRRRQLLLFSGNRTPDAAQSTFTNSAWALTSDGATQATLTYTARNAEGDVLPNKNVTFAVTDALVSAGLSEVTADRAEMENNGTDRTYVTLTLLDTDGNPLVGVPASACVLAVNGSGNTVTQPTGVTSYTGTITGSYVTTQSATKVASFTVASLAITDTASTVASGTGGFDAPDMAEWALVGATNDLRSGPLHDGINGAFLGSAQNAWTYDATGGQGGGPNCTVTYPASGSNQGNGWYLTNGVRGCTIPANTKAVYVSFWHKFETGADVGDPWKGIRFSTAIGGGFSGTFNINEDRIFWDGFNSSLSYYPNTNLPIPTVASRLGTWVHYEFYWDISDEVDWKCQFQGWMDGVLYWDYLGSAATARSVAARVVYSLTQVHGCGVVNRLDSESTQMFGAGGLSSTRIGEL